MSIYLVDQQSDPAVYIAKARLFAESPDELKILGMVSSYAWITSHNTTGSNEQREQWASACKAEAQSALGEVPVRFQSGEVNKTAKPGECATALAEMDSVREQAFQKIVKEARVSIDRAKRAHQVALERNPGRTCLSRDATELGSSCMATMWNCEDNPKLEGCSSKELRTCRAPLMVPASWNCPLTAADKKMLDQVMGAD